MLNKLFKYTSLQTSFSVNNIALVKGRPVALNLKDLILHFVEHRHEVVVRRTEFELRKAEERAHILEGLLIALDNLDEIITLIRGSKTPEEARNGLMERFELSEIQARAILDMRLQKLTGLERDKVKAEYAELMETINDLKDILGNEERRMSIIKEELEEIKEKYGDERRTEIVYSADDFKIEDIIPNEKVVITISHLGYMKRTKLDEYKIQNRGGRGSKGSSTRDEDFLEHLFVANNHNYLLIFTEKGRCFWMRVFEIPEGSKTSKGRAIQNMVQIEPDDRILTYINVPDLKDTEFVQNHYIVLCTKNGVIKKTSLEAYSRPRANGIIAINIRDEDQLLGAKLTDGESHILMALKSGKAIHFEEGKVRPMGRGASGVRGIRLNGDDDEVIGMISVMSSSSYSEDDENADAEEIEIEEGESTVLVVSENGYGKRTAVGDYRITNRGGKGVKTMNITEKTGKLVGILNVKNNDNLMIINQSGLTIRLELDKVRVMGRNTQGVRLINLKNGDSIASVAKIEVSESEEEFIDDDVDINGVEGEESTENNDED